jgi:hypothetical protein
MSIPTPELVEMVKRRVIMAMFADDELMDRLVLKGGNLLDIVYGISTRASADLDFSVDGDLGDVAALRVRLERTLKATFAEIGYEVFDVRVREVPTNLTPDMAAFWGGYQVEFKIIEQAMSAKFTGDLEQIRRNAASIGSRGSSKFEIDISKHEYCAGKLPRGASAVAGLVSSQAGSARIVGTHRRDTRVSPAGLRGGRMDVHLRSSYNALASRYLPE